MVILPLTLTRGGEIQKIFFFLSLEIANAVPIVIAAGKVGGIVIVTKSRQFTAISEEESY